MMRRGCGTGWLDEGKPHENKFMGVNLGADFVAEHEGGIQVLHGLLGVSDDVGIMGIDRYKVTDTRGLRFVEEPKGAALILDQEVREPDFYKDAKFYENDFVSAWDEKGFIIRVKGEKNVAKLKRIHQAMLDKNAAVWRGGGMLFGNPGMIIGIISLITDDLKKQMKDAHLDKQRLAEASVKTGIREKIDAINRKFKDEHETWQGPLEYFALRAAWKKGVKSKHPVVYWLNPCNQDKVNYGWFTVEQLEEWIEGKGPIPKKSE